MSGPLVNRAITRNAPLHAGRDERWGVWGAMSGPRVNRAITRNAPLHAGRDERWGVWGAMSGPPTSTGRRSAQGWAASNAAAARSTPASSRQRPTICRPTGKPDFVKPQGTEMAGTPTTVKAYVVSAHWM